MRSNHCLTVLHVFILAVLIFTLDADSDDYEDYDCSPGMKVRRHTVHKASLGGDLMIDCPVTFCNNSPPIVSWRKVEKSGGLVNVNMSTHIKTEWKTINNVEGILYLIFHNIQINNSGQYRCQSGLEVSHAINVSVNDNAELPKDLVMNKTDNTSDSKSQPGGDDMLMYRAPGVTLFVIIVITMYVASKHGWKGAHCSRKSKNSLDLSLPPLPGGNPANQNVLSTIHINENDPNDPVYSNLLS